MPPNTLTGPGTDFTGPLRAVVGEYDGCIWIPPPSFFCTTATLTAQRIAAGDYAIRRPAAAQTDVLYTSLSENLLGKYGTDPLKLNSNYGVVPDTIPNPKPAANSGVFGATGSYPFSSGHAIRGFQICGAVLVYRITTAAPTSFTISFYRRKQLNNAAPTITTDPGGPYTVNGVAGPTSGFVLTAQANRYSALIVFNTPYTIGFNDRNTDDWFELSVVGTGTAVVDIMGLMVLTNYNLL